MIAVYLRAAPWALPVFAVGAVVVLLLAGRVARRWGWSRTEVSLLGLATLGFLAVTVTPGNAWRPMSAGRGLSAEVVLVGPGDLTRLSNEVVLNVWLAVPMALVAGYAAARHRRWWPVVLVLVSPPLAEGVQWAFPPLGRAAYLLGDVVANWQGVVAGLVVGLVVGAALGPTAPRRVPATG